MVSANPQPGHSQLRYYKEEREHRHKERQARNRESDPWARPWRSNANSLPYSSPFMTVVVVSIIKYIYHWLSNDTFAKIIKLHYENEGAYNFVILLKTSHHTCKRFCVEFPIDMLSFISISSGQSIFVNSNKLQRTLYLSNREKNLVRIFLCLKTYFDPSCLWSYIIG